MISHSHYHEFKYQYPFFLGKPAESGSFTLGTGRKGHCGAQALRPVWVGYQMDALSMRLDFSFLYTIGLGFQ